MELRKYETLFLLRPDISEEVQKRVNNRVFDIIRNEEGCKLLRVDDWGTRRTAYPVRKLNKAHFIHVTYAGQPGIVAKVERTIRILDDILKYQSARLKEEVTTEELEKDTVWSVSNRSEESERQAAKERLARSRRNEDDEDDGGDGDDDE